MDLSDLEATFSLENTTPASSQLSVTSPKKQDVTTLLDMTRAQNVAIMLARIKLDLPTIRQAVLEIDDTKLSVDELKSLSKQLPTQEEVTRIRDFGDVSRLSKADQFFSQMISIPRLSQRLECMLYRRKLEIEIEEIRPELNIVRNASRELRSSSRFRTILQTVLAVGNTLNGSTFRGGARGFQLDALLKLKETKTAKGSSECPTLLHYIARVLLRSDPSLITFIEEMPHVEAAARVSVQTITASVQGLATGLAQLQQEIAELQKMRLPPQDRFVVVMKPFSQQVSASVDALTKMSSSLEAELRSMLLFFGENPDAPEAPKPEDFFGLILSFSSSLQKAALEVHDTEVKVQPPEVTVDEPLDTPTAESTIKLGDGQTVKQPTTSMGRAAGLSVGRGDLDQAIRSMRDGRRRARPQRPVSKIFVDGARASRMFE